MIKDSEHPFFRPLWRRIAIVVVCAAWSAFELVMGSPTWSLIAAGMAVYGAWQFLYLYKPAAEAKAGEPDSKE